MTQAQWDRAEPLDNRQTRCMGMTVLVNALMFPEERQTRDGASVIVERVTRT